MLVHVSGLLPLYLGIILSMILLDHAIYAGEYSNGLETGVKSDQDHVRRSRNIHVAVTIDRNSLSDFLLAVHSAVNAAQNPSKVVIHVVACGVNTADARDIAALAESALINCLGNTRREVVPWVLPTHSGFRLQMSGQNSRLKDKKHHWTSPTGADMARFFLPSLFPDVPRLLYIDNDSIIGCCLDEIFDTDFTDPNAIVGIVLDDLKWATATQFSRHYNSTHPLVIKNMRRRGFSGTFAPPHLQAAEKLASSNIKQAQTGQQVQSDRSSGATTNIRRHIRKGGGHGGHGKGGPGSSAPGEGGRSRGSGSGGNGNGNGRLAGIHKLSAEPIGGLGAPGEPAAARHSRQRHRRLAAAAKDMSTLPADPAELSVEEFVSALPRYPNDGVILFNVPRYNIANILNTVDEIARANAVEGEYVVNLGTQQFTVLSLWDRWVELTPRANLRHFPDMARGYLMWFLYNGLIHYAGASKPATICYAEGGMELRRMTYTPWATTVAQLAGTGRSSGSTSHRNSCSAPEPLIANITHCSRHVPKTETLQEFYNLVSLASQSAGMADDGLLYLRIGSVAQNAGLINTTPVTQAVRMHVTPPPTKAKALPPLPADVDGIAYFDALLLNQVSWSWRVYDNDHSNGLSAHTVRALQVTPKQAEKKRLDAGKSALEKAFAAGQAALKAAFEDPAAVKKRAEAREVQLQKHNEENAGNKKAPKFPDPPSYHARRQMSMFTDANICDGRISHTHYVSNDSMLKGPFGRLYPVIDYGGNIDPKSRAATHCQSVLAHIKQEKPRGRAHWDVVAITVDVDLTEAHGQSSLQALLALNLDFMRPKFILARVAIDSGWELGAPEGGKMAPFIGTGRTVPVDRYNVGESPKSNYNDYPVYGGNVGTVLTEGHLPMPPGVRTGVSESNDAGVGTSVHQALRFLTKHGYMAYSDDTGRCKHGAGSAAGTATGAGDSQDTHRYACVWGTAMNTLEVEGL